MPINESKPASNLVVNSEQISITELQNRFGARHEVISDLRTGKHVTILVVETEDVVSGESYALLEGTLKNHFGVLALQTVFDATVPAETPDDYRYDLHISGHLRLLLKD